MGIAKVTRHFQVTVPRDVRRIHNIRVGDTVLFAIEGNRVDFLKMDRERIIREASGAWKDKIHGGSVEYVKGLRGGWEKRMKRLGL